MTSLKMGWLSCVGEPVIDARILGRIAKRGATLRGKNTSACTGGPYKIKKEEFLSQKLGVTNFDYFLAETLYSGQLPRRSMLIIDEAHNLEQKLLGFTDFEISPFALQRYSVAIPTI